MKPGKYGWSHNGSGLVPVQAEQALVRIMHEMQSADRSYGEIADALNQRGATTRMGKPWTYNAVLNVLLGFQPSRLVR